MKKLLTLLFITFGILTFSDQTKAYGYYEMGQGYLFYYTTTDGAVCRDINRLQYSLVDVGFAIRPYYRVDAENIQNYWFLGISQGDNTIVNAHFGANGYPIVDDIFNAGGLPPGYDF